MPPGEQEDAKLHTVLVNGEGQYSIWPLTEAVPAGWRAVNKPAQRSECMRYVDEVWTDMRPLRLRMADGSSRGSGASRSPPKTR
jgi:MbtH protein